MYSSIGNGIALLTLMLFTCFVPRANAEDNKIPSPKIAFSVQPQQCVTLRQGRDCFAKITIQWQKSTDQALCLYQINTKRIDTQKQIICWPKTNQGQTNIAFQSSDNLTYQLRTVKEKELVAETEVVVSWVHKNTATRRRWRLF
jgi:hypothetical protein